MGTLVAILAAILGALGVAVAGQAVTDIVQGVGVWSSSKWKTFIKDLQRVINENSQMLSDFKNKNENQKAQIVNSLLQSSGLGPRAQNLRNEVVRLAKKDETLTKEVTDKNTSAYNEISDAERRMARAETGLIGAAQAGFSEPGEASSYKVNDPNQNVQGGLN